MPLRPHRASRRDLLLASGVLFAASCVPKAARAEARDPRLLVVILRGALDGLAAVAPVGDPDWVALRGDKALVSEGATPALELDGFFALNPAMPNFHHLYRAGEAVVVHAAAAGYRERSHLDGQHVLETGLHRPGASAIGWLNRALAAREWGETVEPMRRKAFAVGPATQPRPGPGVQAHAYFARTAGAAAKFMALPAGPRIGALIYDGWDTHADQGAVGGRLSMLLAGLDGALAAIEAGMGPAWRDTVVAVMTEFGRTVRINGTKGTDHGTATAMLLAGGALRGGRVICDWPGLKRADLHEGRDLRPTTDVRAVLKGVLGDHLRIGEAALAARVFPGSGAAKSLPGLIRSI